MPYIYIDQLCFLPIIATIMRINDSSASDQCVRGAGKFHCIYIEVLNCTFHWLHFSLLVKLGSDLWCCCLGLFILDHCHLFLCFVEAQEVLFGIFVAFSLLFLCY